MSYRAFRVFGPRRSGHHAVVNWILEQIEGRSLFIHNLEDIPNGYPYKIENGQAVPADPSYLAADQEVETYGEGEELAAVLYNFEDQSLEQFQNLERKVPVPDEVPTTTVLILRDPLNLLASRVKSFRSTGIDLFISEPPINFYLHWCIRMIEGEELFDDFVLMNYNRWFSNEPYRQELAEQLRIPFTDKGKEKQVENSSFDGFSYADKNAEEMKVLERYKSMLDDVIFVGMLKSYAVLIDHINDSLFSDFAFPKVAEILESAVALPE